MPHDTHTSEDLNTSALATPAIKLLTDIRQGELCHELSEELERLAKAVQATGKKGQLTLKITIKPTGMGRVSVGDDLTTKLPKGETPATPMFATELGQLLVNDPAQMKLPLNVSHIKERPLKQA
jgi:hypothetical protein